MTFDFVAIDFETANNNNNSACSLGMVMVKDKQIVDKKYFLIHPPTPVFDPNNISIHGITYDDVKDTPRFPYVWGQILDYFKTNTIIAHNAQFDMSVLKCCLDEYGLDCPDFNYMCSIPISTKACTDENIGRSLEDRARYFDINIDKHHNALSDAETCARIVIESIKKTRRKSFESFCKTYYSLTIRSFSDLKPNRRFRYKKFEKIIISEIVAATSDKFNINNELYGKNIVFTGELRNMVRKEAMQKVVDLGGNIRSTVSPKTNYLVVGIQDKSIVGDDGLSKKEEKAYDLFNRGFDIKIIDENEFLNIINN